MTGKDEDVIRKRAYALWESEGRPEGKHDDHWLRAHAGSGEDEGETSTETEKQTETETLTENTSVLGAPDTTDAPEASEAPAPVTAPKVSSPATPLTVVEGSTSAGAGVKRKKKTV